tara:strand:- start:1497 stop:2198 length:702 start_codon:yes stop_codon:yes gene_type:complete
MIKLLTGGGFGDAAMSVGKLYSKHTPFKVDLDNIHLTHVEVGSILLSPIKNFYKTQNINITVKEISNWEEKEVMRTEYDYYLGTHWSHNNIGDESTWEINPFPLLKFNKISNIDTLISISGGRPDKFRGFTNNDIIELDNKYENITFIGQSNDNFYSEYNFKNNNMVNKTDIQQLVDCICSCNIFIGYAGFSMFLAAMAKKDVYGIKNSGDGWEYRVHPKWRVREISNIGDIS